MRKILFIFYMILLYASCASAGDNVRLEVVDWSHALPGSLRRVYTVEGVDDQGMPYQTQFFDGGPYFPAVMGMPVDPATIETVYDNNEVVQTTVRPLSNHSIIGGQ